ncbi:sulfatase [Verrucomicrobiaceae bacterium N1E253]|uniref:Sulfatase n=1 Tax=Oceaniferula marina TaxID=2748318 RepID=A0A851GEB2_9BACT|nr:sulfatase [Oceaniferula marina]NWK55252.1 sulfatase [Oceaniferula marina]
MIHRHLKILTGALLLSCTFSAAAEKKKNVLFIIADDLTARALSCYENKASKTPNIDKLATEGIRYTRTYCQFPVCGPSRASLMSGYYPLGSGAMGYASGRKQIGDRITWTQHFQNNGYHTARVSKIFHMNVPGNICSGSNGADDALSWNERHNVKAQEMHMEGEGEMLERNPDGTKPVKFGNHLQYVKGGEADELYADAQAADKACELLKEYKQSLDKPFFLAVGFVRPHVPFVAPKSYFEAYPIDQVVMPKKVEGDHEDIPEAGLGQFTSSERKVTPLQEKKAVAAYYAAVAHMDAQVGKVLTTLKEQGLEDDTIIIFTSDHGYHLGEHNFWMKISVHEESARVPMIIKVPGKEATVCHTLTELVDLYPTISEACGLDIPKNIQGKSLYKTFDDPAHSVRDAALSMNGRGMLLRTKNWAYIEYANGDNGAELYDMVKDPQQFVNLVKDPEHASTLKNVQQMLIEKKKWIMQSDIRKERASAPNPETKKKRKKAKT